jgi:hypothetical protein
MGQSLREQLTEALKDCQRQIEILRLPSGAVIGGSGGFPDNREEIAVLETEYRRLQQALAELGSENT